MRYSDETIAEACRRMAKADDYTKDEFHTSRCVGAALDLPPREVRLAWQRVRDNDNVHKVK